MTWIGWIIRPPPQWLIRLAAGGLMLGALLGSVIPQMGPPSEYGIDKMVHILGYGALAFTLGEIRGMKWPLVLVLAITMGGVAELLQTAIPEREGSWADFLAGGLGAILGLSIQLILTGVRRRKLSSPVDGAPGPTSHGPTSHGQGDGP